MTIYNSFNSKPLMGDITPPGDKSISHRALILSALAIGQSKIIGILESEDVLCTAEALKLMGVKITINEGIWYIDGCGSGGLTEPRSIINCGNSGTSARLLIGLLSTHSFNSIITGDESLKQRPMDRIILPMTDMGAKFSFTSDKKLPIHLNGTGKSIPISYKLPQPSAQIKSAILIAGLQTPGKTSVIETIQSRDHTEKMMLNFGVDISITNTSEGKKISVTGQNELTPFTTHIPGDFSSAAFLIVACLIIPDSYLKIKDVGINPLRIGLLETLIEMGGKIEISNKRFEGQEPLADITVKSSSLLGINIPSSRAPSMIDEYPILAIASAFASGDTVMNGLEELRVKESNRVSSTAQMLKDCGTEVIEKNNSLVIKGQNGNLKGGSIIKTYNDHRIAMSALVAGMASREPIGIDNDSMINTSFPDFINILNTLGSDIRANKK